MKITLPAGSNKLKDALARAMVYVIEGDIVLVSRSVLEILGCIPKHFPRVGEFQEPDDKALTGKLFAINSYPTGWMSGGTYHGVIKTDNNTANNDEVKLVNKAEAIIPPVHHQAGAEETHGGGLKVTTGHLTDPITNLSL